MRTRFILPGILAIFYFCFSANAESLRTQAFYNMGEATESQVRSDASGNLRTQFSSQPPSVPSYVNFEGYFIPDSNDTEVAIFSDDGVDFYVDDVRVMTHKDEGQHLPDLTQSFRVVDFDWETGQAYKIKIEYSNGWYYPDLGDIDGCTMYAYNGGGTVTDSKVVSITGPHEVNVGENATFYVTTDPESAAGNVDWSGGGSPASAQNQASFTTQWDTSGTKAITATTDASCPEVSQTLIVDVVDGPKIGVILSVSDTTVPLCNPTVTFTATCEDQDYQNGSMVSDTVDQYTWYVDGVEYTPGANQSSITLDFDSVGTKVIEVVADDHPYYTDDDPVTASVTTLVVANSELPIIAHAVQSTDDEGPWQGETLNVGVGTAVYFKGDWEEYPSSDSDVGDDCDVVADSIASYEWDFGDEDTDTGASVSHTYPTTNNYMTQYTASLVVDDTGSPVNDAPSDPCELTVRVFERVPDAPTVDEPAIGTMCCGLSPTIRWTGLVHDQFQVRVNLSDDPDEDIVWDSDAVTSEESEITCGQELGENTAYYVFVREHNVLGWGDWSDTGQVFTVNTPENPIDVSVSPSSGTFTAGTIYSFTANYSDSCLYTNISTAELLIDDSTLDKAFSCYLKYDQATNQCWLAEDGGTTWVGGEGYTPGSENTLENSQVKVYLENTSVSGQNADLSVTWSIEFKPAFAGEKTLSLAVFSNSGLNGEDDFASFGTITIEPASGPTSEITSPENGTFINSVPVVITGTAADTYGVDKVEVSMDGGETWQEATGTTSWSYSWSDMEDGSYNIKSRAYSTSEAVEEPSSGINVWIDRMYPVSQISDPEDGSYVSGTDIDVSGIAVDSTSGISKVELSFNDGDWVEAEGTSAFCYTYTLPESGEVNIRSRATDSAGNVETPGAGITIYVEDMDGFMERDSSASAVSIPDNANIFDSQKTMSFGPYFTINLCTFDSIISVPITSWKCMDGLAVDLKMVCRITEETKYTTYRCITPMTHTYNLVLVQKTGSFELDYPDGYIQQWFSDRTPINGNFDQLDIAPSGEQGYVMKRKDGTKWAFTKSIDAEDDVSRWKLTRIEGPSGKTIKFTYDAKNRLQYIVDPATSVDSSGKPAENGRWLYFSYNGNGNITEIQSSLRFGSSAVRPQTWWLHYSGTFLSSIEYPHPVSNENDEPQIPSSARGTQYNSSLFSNYPIVSVNFTLGSKFNFTAEDANGSWNLRYDLDTSTSTDGGWDKTLVLTDPAGAETTCKRQWTRCVSLWPPDNDLVGRSSRFTYVTDPMGRTAEYEHIRWGERRAHLCGSNKYGRFWWPGYRLYRYIIDDKTDPKTARKTHYQGDWNWVGENGLLNWYVDEEGRGTACWWDANGNLTKQQSRSGEYTETTYTAYNEPDTVSVPSPSGRKITKYYYDATYPHRCTKVIDDYGTGHLNITKEYTYDAYGNLETEVGPYQGTRPENPPFVKYYYDSQFHSSVVKTTDQLGRFTEAGYNNMGWKVWETLPRLKSSETKAQIWTDYDKMGRPYYINHADGTDEKNQYLDNNQVGLHWNSGGHTTQYLYDEAGRLWKSRSQRDTNVNVWTRNEYNDSGEVMETYTGSTEEADKPTAFYDYDGVSRLYKVRSPATTDYPSGTYTQYIDYGPAAYGSRKYTKSPRGGYSEYYNLDNRMVRKESTNGGVTRRCDYDYYSGGLLYHATDAATGGPAGEYTYDTASRLTSEKRTDLNRKTVTTYDSYGRVYTVTLKNAAGTTTYDSWTYTYYADNKLKTVLHLGENIPTAFYYDSRGRLVKKTYPNHATSTITYRTTGPTGTGVDTMNLVDRVKHTLGSVSKELVYSYDNLGNVTGIVEGAKTYAYTYDWLGRLLSEKLTAGAAVTYWYEYEYDARGNRTEKTNLQTSVTSAFTYDDDNKLISSTNPTVTYYYDADGNLTQKKDCSGNTIVQYGYDFANRLNQISVPGNPTIYFDYTVDGERYRRKDNTTVTTQFVYASGGSLAQELDGSGVITAYYDPGVSQKVKNGVGWTKLFMHGDLLGSTRWLSTGTVFRTEFVYDAWGNIISTTGGDTTNFKYGGKEGYYADTGTGLMKLGARYYDPTIGRFITKDPARDGVNWYAYAGNNPIDAIDPSGLKPIDVSSDDTLQLSLGAIRRFFPSFSDYVSQVDSWYTERDFGFDTMALTESHLVPGKPFLTSLGVVPTWDTRITVGFNPDKYPTGLISTGSWYRRTEESQFVDFTTTVLHELMHVKNLVNTGNSGGFKEWKWNLLGWHIRGDSLYYQKKAENMISPVYGDIYKWYKKQKRK